LPIFREHTMKTLFKRIVMQLYCRDWIAGATATRLFRRFKLRSA
jgi:hypothetical protein